MNDTQVRIADEPGGPSNDGPATYQNLWVPLIVVPAGIVGVIVLVVALFGSLAGGQRTPGENLALIASGGKNERTQALMDLVGQAAENQSARNEDRELPHPYPEDFGGRAIEVIDGLDADDRYARCALGAFLAGLDHPVEAAQRGVDELVSLLAMDEGDDESGELRQVVMINLGLLARGADTPADGATSAVLPYLEHTNVHLRSTAASVLANLDGDGARGALEGALSDSSLSVRAAAAFTLAKLEPAGFAADRVLRELTSEEPFTAAREQDPTQFSSAEGVSQLRIKALQSLALLGRDEDWAHIQTLNEDADLNVRDQVLSLLARRQDQL